MLPFSRRPITTLHALTRSKPITRCYISSQASQTSHDRAARKQLLRTIYARAQGLQPSSTEYTELATSGSCWSSYFSPFTWSTLDTTSAASLKPHLEAIDALTIHNPSFSACRFWGEIGTAYAHQNCVLEHNPLSLAEAEVVHESTWEHMPPGGWGEMLLHGELPAAQVVLPGSGGDKNHIFEIRNALLAQEFMMGLPSMGEQELGKVHRVLMRGLPMERVMGWNEMQHAGSYRTIPMGAKGMPMTVYPYPQELPTLMRKFFLFNSAISNSPHHPIVVACRLYSSLLAIHPFCDGNGRVSRAWMAGYLVSRGYPPMMFARAEPRVLTRHLEIAQKEQDRSGLYSYVVGEMRAMLEMEAGTGRQRRPGQAGKWELRRGLKDRDGVPPSQPPTSLL